MDATIIRGEPYHEVEVTSEPGKGTTVTMKNWCGFDEVAGLLR